MNEYKFIRIFGILRYKRAKAVRVYVKFLFYPEITKSANFIDTDYNGNDT